MSDLETVIRAAFQSNPRVHAMSFGVCTAWKSPGNYAFAVDASGNHIEGVEHPDAIEALRLLCGKITEPVTTTLPGLPGMMTR